MYFKKIFNSILLESDKLKTEIEEFAYYTGKNIGKIISFSNTIRTNIQKEKIFRETGSMLIIKEGGSYKWFLLFENAKIDNYKDFIMDSSDNQNEKYNAINSCIEGIIKFLERILL